MQHITHDITSHFECKKYKKIKCQHKKKSNKIICIFEAEERYSDICYKKCPKLLQILHTFLKEINRFISKATKHPF